MVISREVKNTGELPDAARWLLQNWKGQVLAIEGEMGAGKTTFIQSLCREMGVEDKVSSPTFSLVNEYYSPSYGSLYHFDFYRLEDENEALDMGVEDYLYSGNYCFMEWAEKISNLLPDTYDRLRISVKQGIRIFELNITE
ncbi:MAG TPA: tRNA (adenosine(37)-N6)-threonylcarbamoyltransferase complex ATPase subunit type 1 TsaE [Cryomorphaceae bacterium]|nr:tRNA (adenosine(37)-N6)-threonylcarbamoyltransferase complex ATPase subunit type 1 TsaE [Owenweeksia sp.]MBG00069.1 tRNA (adenosine(37)-N6)-threonylcarbamoyltransferase complex ATPase subunit type 1 TsaE [Owenweeksia sp.]HAD97761.1 tRNA (adenosine(37)-N6)-threonylcarbamoyltransferase complex ATPase subunit type 1 TsaE [Cryomorphaceae bacterium]|tara:strand:- start:198 stop:620 length:423 start_codon:yes stop_codon:yes gene_type:complete